MSDDGTRDRQGRTGQEGQAQEGPEAVVLCQICASTKDAHPFKHEFTPPGVPVDTRQFDRRRNRTPAQGESPSRRVPSDQGRHWTPPMTTTAAPFDPVLRMALIDAGVITVEQLQEAEKKISVFTQQVTKSGPTYRGADQDG